MGRMNPSLCGRLRSRAAALAMAAACVCAAVASGGGGALDVELRNRTLVTGSIREPHELDTVRVRMPTGAALAVTLRGKGKLQPGVRLFDEAGLELDLGASIRRSGKTTTILPFTPGPAGLYRLDVRGDGDVTGDYTLDAGWKLPPKESFAGTTGSDGGYYVFEAEAGTRIDVALRGLDAGATARVTRVTGPRGYELTIKPPKRLGAVHHVVTPALPVSGRYEVEFVTDVGGRSISGTLGRKPSTKKLRQNLRRADVRRAGVARTVSRIFAQDGGGVDVGGLDTDQRVSLDVSGVSLAVPAGTVSYASSFAIRSDDDAINDPLGFAPAGVSVNFDAGKLQLASEVTVRLPYDVGAFTSGDVFSDICILHREADGQVGEISRSSATVDPNAGTVSFPTSRFSSFQVFSPPVELTVVATPGRPNDLAGAPDEEVVYVSTDFLTADLPAAAVLRYSASGGVETYAGGGSKTGDFVNRLDFDFDHDLGLHGVYISSIAAASDGAVFVVTSDQDRTWSMVYFVRITVPSI